MFYAMATQVETLKQKAHALIDQLPDDATWRDVAYRAAVRGDIEAGLADSAADRVTPLDELLKELDRVDILTVRHYRELLQSDFEVL